MIFFDFNQKSGAGNNEQVNELKWVGMLSGLRLVYVGYATGEARTRISYWDALRHHILPKSPYD